MHVSTGTTLTAQVTQLPSAGTARVELGTLVSDGLMEAAASGDSTDGMRPLAVVPRTPGHCTSYLVVA
jgi:hypothetical protein